MGLYTFILPGAAGGSQVIPLLYNFYGLPLMRCVALEPTLYPVPSLCQLCVGPESGQWDLDEGPAQEGRMVVVRPYHGSARGGLTGR